MRHLVPRGARLSASRTPPRSSRQTLCTRARRHHVESPTMQSSSAPSIVQCSACSAPAGALRFGASGVVRRSRDPGIQPSGLVRPDCRSSFWFQVTPPNTPGSISQGRATTMAMSGCRICFVASKSQTRRRSALAKLEQSVRTAIVCCLQATDQHAL